MDLDLIKLACITTGFSIFSEHMGPINLLGRPRVEKAKGKRKKKHFYHRKFPTLPFEPVISRSTKATDLQSMSTETPRKRLRFDNTELCHLDHEQ